MFIGGVCLLLKDHLALIPFKIQVREAEFPSDIRGLLQVDLNHPRNPQDLD